jgi:arginine N-succinyltransferase
MIWTQWQDHAPSGAQPPHETEGGCWCLAGQGPVPTEATAQAWLHWQPQVGRSRVRYHFALGRVVHAAPELGLHHVQQRLLLGMDGTGESELSALHASAQCPPPVLQALLDAALQAWRAAPGAAQCLLVELPGWRDERGRSPFWDGLVRAFLPGELQRQREALGPAFTSELGLLLPQQPLHAVFLPEAARQALGRVRDDAGVWLAALQASGFAPWGRLRIDDAGPVWAFSRGGSQAVA